jgi:hypothetical protein
MYETPQYLTPDGYRRLPKNPYRKKAQELEAKLVDDPAIAQKKKVLAGRIPGAQKKRPQLELSDEAAKLIAQALKGMLKK